MMKTTKLKKIEKAFVSSLANYLVILKKFFIAFLKFFLNIGNQKITIMLVPHSEKRVFNFRVNVFLMFTLFIMSVGIGGTVVYFTIDSNRKMAEASYYSDKAQKQELRAREYDEMVSTVLNEHGIFRSNLQVMLRKINSNKINEILNNRGAGGASPESKQLGNRELSDLEYKKMEVDRVVLDYQITEQALKEINKMVNDYNKVLKDLPFGHPVKGGYAIVTSTFGFRIHPIFKVLDMHQGIDLANIPGTPLVSTAPGVVEKVEYNPTGYGWYIKISHKLGYSTLYAHMRSKPLLDPGDKVRKGEVIGYMGSTGISTSSHLHYEIRLGNNLLDPWPFVDKY